MDDALLMRRFEGFGDLLGNRQRFVERERSARDPLRQILALDEFHDEGADVPRGLNAVDGCDVGVIEGRERVGFAGESREPFGITGEELGQDLERDVAIELGVPRPIHLAHAAYADLDRDFVDAEAGAGGKGQAGSPWIIRAVRQEPGPNYSWVTA